MLRRLSHFHKFKHLPWYAQLSERLAQIEARGTEDPESISLAQDALRECDSDASDSVIVASSLIPGAGKGLFARKRLPQFACVGTFWGYDLGWGEASSYAALHEPADVTTGRLWPEFEKCPVLYLNEPPLECEASCGWGAVRAVGDLRLHQQIYTLREIEAGEELFLYYGSFYQYRNYGVSPNSKLQWVTQDKGGEWSVRSEDSF